VTIDVDALKARTDLVAVVGAYVSLKKRGAEYVGLCPFHSDNNPSFWVIPSKQFCHCFSCGANKDVIEFIMDMEGLDFKAACEFLGAAPTWTPKTIRHEAKPLPDRVTSKPPPDAGKPHMKINGLGEPSQTWAYRDSDGGILGYVARYDPPEGKQIRCWTWGKRADSPAGWGCGHWTKPRPLYGLDRLSARADAAVLVVEGEKAADAAQKLLPAYAVVTWPGGSQSWHKANWETLKGRKVLLWPDNDAPGVECMGKVAEWISDPRTLACSVRIIDPTGMPDGFDAADWQGTTAELVAWAKPRARDYHHAETQKHGLTNPAPPVADRLAAEGASSPTRPELAGAGPDYLSPIEAYEDDGAPPTQPAKRPINGHAVMGEVFYRSMSEVESRAIDWLWPGRFAKGKVSMIVGNPGLGKSQVCASIVSVVSNGGTWPVDRLPCGHGSVLILSAEDDPEDTIRPRLEAAGANLDKVFILDAIRVDRQDGPGKRGFDLTMDIAKMGALLHVLNDAALVIIDPITAYLGDADSHKNAEVRALLAPLSEMAAAQRVAVIAVSHLTKSSGMDALLRVQGSIGFAAAARAVWGVAKDKDNPARRLFMPLKNNLGTDTNGFAYSVEGVRLPESDIETSHVMWENQPVTQSAEEVFGESDLSNDEKGAVFEAKLFLRDLLRHGPVDSRQIELDARGAGHAMTTLRRAAKEMNLRIAKDGFGKGAPWKWWPQEG
jgi:putative DNA primase/helicase